MTALILFWVVMLGSLAAAWKMKKPALLLMPFLAIGTYMVIEIAKVPLPFWETVQLIFGLQ